MNELQIVNLENTEITTWNFPMMKAELQRGLDTYAGIVYTDDSIKDAKNDRATLNKLRKAIDGARKAYKAKCLAPYEALEPQIKELLNLVDGQKNQIDSTVRDFEERQKKAKEQEVRAYYDRKSAPLEGYADALYPMLFDKKWVNASTKKAKYEEDILIAISVAAADIKKIKAIDSPFVDTLLEVYADTLSMEQVQTKQKELEDAARKASLTTVESAAAAVGVQAPVAMERPPVSANADDGVAMKVYASQGQMNQIMDFMKAIGVRYEIL